MGRVPVRSKKIPVIKRPHYTIYLEQFRKRKWVHVDVFKWTLSIKKQYQADMASIRGPLYAANIHGCNKLIKFILLTQGWSFYRKMNFGKMCDVYRRL